MDDWIIVSTPRRTASAAQERFSKPRRAVAWMLLLAVVLLCATGPADALGQERVPLILNDDAGGGHLPKGTQVLVLENGAGGAQSLTDLDIRRDSLSTRLQEAARSNPVALLDTLAAEGTSKATYATGVLYYVLARTPDGTLYESHVNDGVGFDKVVSGNMRIRPVPADAQEAMKTAFDEAVETASTTRLTLQGAALPAGTDVRVWRTKQDAPTPLGTRQPWTRESTADKLAANGTTAKRFGRTWYSGAVLYVAARTPEGALYESQVSGEPGFDVIQTGTIKMAKVPEGERQAALETVFVPPSGLAFGMTKLSGTAGWLVFGLFGLIVGLATAWWWRGREVSALQKRHRKAKRELMNKERELASQSRLLEQDDDGHRETNRELEQAESEIRRLRSEKEELNNQIRAIRRQSVRMKEAMRKPESSRQPQQQRPAAPPPLQDRIDRVQPRSANLQRLKTQNEEYRDEIQRLRARLDAAPPNRIPDREDILSPAWASIDPPRTNGSEDEAEAATDEPLTEHESSPSQREQVGFAFAEWCANGGVMVGRYYMFESALQETVPDAQVSRIYHDARTDDRFGADVSDVSGEFWLVALPSEAVLLPVPKRDGTFRALAPAFDADDAAVAHTDIETVLPAQLAAADSGYRIRSTGTLR